MRATMLSGLLLRATLQFKLRQPQCGEDHALCAHQDSTTQPPRKHGEWLDQDSVLGCIDIQAEGPMLSMLPALRQQGPAHVRNVAMIQAAGSAMLKLQVCRVTQPGSHHNQNHHHHHLISGICDPAGSMGWLHGSQQGPNSGLCKAS
jgi:hypothetical protein